MVGIYGIHSTVSDKWYVGQSMALERRRRYHKSRLAAETHPNSHLQLAWNKYGESSFEFVVLEAVEDAGYLTEREEFWLEHKRCTSAGVYNMRIVVDSCRGIQHSPEARANMSAAQTPERRAKVADAIRGQKRSPEARARMCVAQKIRRRQTSVSAETCAKISAALLGKKHTSEHIAKASAARTGSKRSPESRAKMSAARMGIQYSPETLEKMRKFSDADIMRTRELKAQGVLVGVIAEKFNCCSKTIYRVVNGTHGYAFSKDVR